MATSLNITASGLEETMCLDPDFKSPRAALMYWTCFLEQSERLEVGPVQILEAA